MANARVQMHIPLPVPPRRHRRPTALPSLPPTYPRASKQLCDRAAHAAAADALERVDGRVHQVCHVAAQQAALLRRERVVRLAGHGEHGQAVPALQLQHVAAQRVHLRRADVDDGVVLGQLGLRKARKRGAVVRS